MKSVNWSTVSKGSAFTVEQLEEITGKQYGTTAYQLEVLKFARKIEAKLAKKHGKIFISERKGSLVVLTDAEAVNEAEARHQAGKRRIYLNQRRSQDIDSANLNHRQNLEHMNALSKRALEIQALQRAGREFQPDTGKAVMVIATKKT